MEILPVVPEITTVVIIAVPLVVVTLCVLRRASRKLDRILRDELDPQPVQVDRANSVPSPRAPGHRAKIAADTRMHVHRTGDHPGKRR
jgi:hypothetical protein